MFSWSRDIHNIVSGHVETICLLSNRKPDSYVHLNLKMENYYRIKDAEKEQKKSRKKNNHHNIM